MKTLKIILAILLLLATPLVAAETITLPGLDAPVTVVRDGNGVPHVYAHGERDLFFVQGRIHAEDRLWQMDLLRRSAAGTLAELFGPDLLESDVQTRAIGFARAAVRSLAAHPPEFIEILQAYSDGVNSLIAALEAAGRLPPEYGGLGLSRVERWTPLDTVLVGKALGAGTSFDVAGDIDLTVVLRTYEGVGDFTRAFDGNKLFFEDLFRSAPIDPASTVPDAEDAFPSQPRTSRLRERIEALRAHVDDRALERGGEFVERIRKLPRIPGAIKLEADDLGGSNTWVIAGKHTRSGRPLLANDAHLPLESPTFFHDMHLVAPGFEATGSSLPGTPCIARGHNRWVAWGVTNARLDITDVYAEVIQEDGNSPSGYATLHGGVAEPVEVVPEFFRANIGGQVVPMPIPEVGEFVPVLIVPRRNHGPLITPPGPGGPGGLLTAFSVQSVAFGPTRDPEGLCALNRARNLDEFKAGLRLIDFASQNFSYADRHGNIAYFISGELPLREDLQHAPGPVAPPFLIRNGFAGNDWLPLDGPAPAHQATPYAILPFDEMPQVVNPRGGVIVNANNDPVGNTLDNDPLDDFRAGGDGRRYLSWGGRSFSLRAGRISEMIAARLAADPARPWRRGKVGFDDMREMQADTLLSDARVFRPRILEAWANATDSGAHPALAAFTLDPRLGEAVERLRRWNFTTPTGIPEGRDAKRGADDAANSVATTIYSTWRARMVANSIDATLDAFGLPRPGNREELLTALQHLFELDGIGKSRLNFFNVPDVDDADQPTRRDILVLASLAEALTLLASDDFVAAFGNSTEQDDYRWGKLHRIVFRHALGDAEANFNVPPAFGLVASPLPGLAGIPTDGGFETVDVAPPLSANNVRLVDGESGDRRPVDSFMFDSGPTGRFVAWLGWFRIRAVTSLPGGESGVPGSPFYVNLLEPFLDNRTYPLSTSPHAVRATALSTVKYVP